MGTHPRRFDADVPASAPGSQPPASVRGLCLVGKRAAMEGLDEEDIEAGVGSAPAPEVWEEYTGYDDMDAELEAATAPAPAATPAGEVTEAASVIPTEQQDAYQHNGAQGLARA